VYLATPPSSDVLTSYPVAISLTARTGVYFAVFGIPVLVFLCLYFACAYRNHKRASSASIQADTERAPLASQVGGPPQQAPPAYTPAPPPPAMTQPVPPFGAYPPTNQQPYGNAASVYPPPAAATLYPPPAAAPVNPSAPPAPSAPPKY
jgi:hypothetical protein